MGSGIGEKIFRNIFVIGMVFLGVLMGAKDGLDSLDSAANPPQNFNDLNEQFNLQRKEYLQHQNILPKSNASPLQKIPESSLTNIPPDSASSCFEIDDILLVSSLSSFQDQINKEFSFLSSLLKSYTHQCLNVSKITELLNALRIKAFERGYITTDFGLKAQDLSTHKLFITLQTTLVDEIYYDDGDDVNILFWGKDYAIKKGDILSIAPIEKGLYNFKRFKTLNPTMQISNIPTPSDKLPKSKITIAHHKTYLPFYAFVGADNAGSNGTGIYQTSLQMGLENYFALSDAFHSYIVFTPVWKKSHSFYGSLDFSISFRRLLFTVSGSYSQYTQSVAISQNLFSYSGYSANLDIKGDVLLYMDSLNRFNLNFGMGKRWAKNYLENIELLTQHRNLSNIYASLGYLRFFGASSFNINVGIKQGVKFLGAMNNFVDKNAQTQPDFFYTIPTIDIYTYVPLNLWKKNLIYSGFVKTQVSRTQLYASEKFGLGGIYSVRGFDTQALSGEFGILNRNDLAYYLPLFFNLSVVPSLGLDMGYVSDIYGRVSYDLGNKGFLIGGGAGLKILWGKYLNLQFWGYAPMYNPKNLKGRYFYMSAEFGW